MGIFGKMDAEKVKTNPFFVGAGEYYGEVTDAGFKTKNVKGEDQPYIYFEFKIEDETSEFNGKKVRKQFNIYDISEEELLLMPADEQRKIRNSNSNLKRLLCGADGNTENQPGFGINPDDLNDPEWDPKVVKGLKVNFMVKNFGANDTGVDVAWANIAD